MWSRMIWFLLPRMMVIVAVAWIFLKDRARMWYLAPLILLGAAYALLLARFAISPVYLLPGFAPLIPLVGIMIDLTDSKIGNIGLLTATLCLIWASGVRQLMAVDDRTAREDLDWLATKLSNRNSLVDGGHIYQYYFGSNYDIRSISLSYNAHTLFFRENGEYRPVRKDELAGRLVVVQKRPNQTVGGEAAQLLNDCQKFDRNHVTLWDCANPDRHGL
jgi:hypothetical protein